MFDWIKQDQEDCWEEELEQEQAKTFAECEQELKAFQKEYDGLEELEIIEMLPFSHLEPVMKKKISSYLFAAGVCLVLGILFLWADLHFWSTSLIFAILSLLLLAAARQNYVVAATGLYYIFTGTVQELFRLGKLKAVRSTLVRLESESGQQLCLKVPGEVKFGIGTLLTLYIPAGAPIVQSEYGPTVENVLSFERGRKTPERNADTIEDFFRQ